MTRPAGQKRLSEAGGQELRAKGGGGGGAKATKSLVNCQGEGNGVQWEKEQGDMSKDPCGCRQGEGSWVPPFGHRTVRPDYSQPGVPWRVQSRTLVFLF